MKNKSLLLLMAIIMIAMSSLSQVTGKMTDARDGKVYKTVTIGEQTWMAENLNYANGWCYNDDYKNCDKYGVLYEWEAAKKGCPIGWHLPNDAEWSTLIDYLGGESIAGGKLKSTKGWGSPNTGATNSSGFTALPGGKAVDVDPVFGSECIGIGVDSFWWSSSEHKTSNAWYRQLSNDDSDVYRAACYKRICLSVRCVKDN